MHLKNNITVLPTYFDTYIAHVPNDLNLMDGLSNKIFNDQLLARLELIQDRAYSPNKWTVKQCIQHITDTERIFQYRALRISRNDTTPLPGFNQDNYAEVANLYNRGFNSLIDELNSVRQSSIFLFESLGDKELSRVGNCSSIDISVLALGFITIGHQLHHEKIFVEKYLD